MFGDNKTVVDCSTISHSKLHNRHTILSFHRVHEAIASGMVAIYYLPGAINPADILSKHWGYTQIWSMLQPLLFWQGDTADLIKDEVMDLRPQILHYICLDSSHWNLSGKWGVSTFIQVLCTRPDC